MGLRWLAECPQPRLGLHRFEASSTSPASHCLQCELRFRLLPSDPQGSPDLGPGGLPYGFFSEPLERFPAGYPVLLDTRLSAQRAEQALTYVRDGGFLSATLTK